MMKKEDFAEIKSINDGAAFLEAAVNYGKELVKIQDIEPESDMRNRKIAVPAGFEILEVSRPEFPDRKRATVDLTSVESFVEYLNEHKTKSSRIFAKVNEAPFGFRAIVDFNEAGADGKPDWGTHEARLTLTETEEWRIWSGQDRRGMGQLEFADFIKQNRMDIVFPDGATLLEIALTLTVTSGGHCRSKINLKNGSTHLDFVENAEAKAGADGSVEIPDSVALRLSPFVGVPPEEIEADFQYRQRDGKITFTYLMQRPKALIRKVVSNAVKIIRENVGLPVFHGSYSSEY